MKDYDCSEDNEVAKEVLNQELTEKQFFFLEAKREWEEKNDLVYK